MDLCCGTNYKNNNSQERVDVNEIFNDDDFEMETDEEADDASDSSEDALFEDDEIDNN